MYVEEKYYDTLKVKRSDTFDDIRKKYMDLASKYKKENKMVEFDKLNLAWSLVAQYHEEDINRVKKDDDNSLVEKKNMDIVNDENTIDVKSKLKMPIKETSNDPNKTLKCPKCNKMNYPTAYFCSNCFYTFKSDNGLELNIPILESIFSVLEWIFEKLFMYDNRLSLSRILCFLIVYGPVLLIFGRIVHFDLLGILSLFILFSPIYFILRVVELIYHHFV
jgi:hypothetical protein